MKKLISISVALVLLVTFMVPVAVGAENGNDLQIDNPGAYSKTPFGILGTGIQLVGNILRGLSAVIDGFIPAELGLATEDIAVVTDQVGHWTGVNLAWMTDMTGWSMVAVGDVLTVLTPIGGAIGFPLDGYLEPVSDVFYVLGARMLDEWDSLVVGVPVTPLPEPGLGLPVYKQTQVDMPTP